MKCLFPLVILIVFSIFLHGGPKDSISLNIERHIETTDPSLPLITVLFENNVSDISICLTPDKTYYLTGTTGDKYGVQQGILVWASRDMKDWNLIGRNNGYVWTFDDDAVEWQKEITTQNGWKQRGIIAPKIHYFKNTFWLTYTNSNSNQSGILKSVSGRADGPYEEVSGNRPLVKGEKASLFEDTDNTVYFIWGNGLIHRMKDDMSGFATSEPRILTDASGNRLSMNGLQIQKIGGDYVVSGSRWSSTGLNKNPGQNHMVTQNSSVDDRYDGVLAISKRLFDNYQYNRNVLPHAGGGHLVENIDGKLFYVFSGVDAGNPMASIPSLLPLKFVESGQFEIEYKLPVHATKKQPVVYVSHDGNNSNGNSWANAYTSIQRAVEMAPRGAQLWIARGTYEAPIEIILREGLYLYGGFKGVEKLLEQRDSEMHKVIINGRNSVKNVISINSSSYIRIDGVTIQGGYASGGSYFQQYGAGVHILGGGETIRLVNCTFDNNRADQDGGALYASIGAAPLIINCTFRNNFAKNNGGAVAIYSNTPNGYKTRIVNCTFDNNLSYGHGGAIFFDTNKRDFGILYLINSLLINNTSLGENGIITLNGNSNLLMSNSTLCFNKGSSRGAVMGSLGKVPAKSRIFNSIFYRNSGGYLFSIEGEAESNSLSEKSLNIWVQFNSCLFDQNDVYALVQRNFDRKKWNNVAALNQSVLGVNCLTGEPQFVEHFNGNYRLSNNSDARNKGTSAYYFDFDLDGKPRVSGSVNIGCY